MLNYSIPPTRGFTMIEFLISVFISAFVFLIGLSTITMTQRAQNTATANLRIAENTRVFFDTLERDLSGAYPAGYASMRLDTPAAIRLMDTPTVPLPINKSDALQFFSKTDHARTPDAVVLLRYYVARNDANDLRRIKQDRTTVCREVLNGYLIEQGNDFVAPQPIDPATGNSTAVFDGVKKLKISYRRWVRESKQFEPALSSTLDGDPATATHLLVRLYMIDPDGGPDRMFQKAIPIPQAFFQ